MIDEINGGIDLISDGSMRIYMVMNKMPFFFEARVEDNHYVVDFRGETEIISDLIDARVKLTGMLRELDVFNDCEMDQIKDFIEQVWQEPSVTVVEIEEFLNEYNASH